MDPSNTNNLLQLARRLHEEHVREGMEKRDALIAEGHAAAARVVAEAEMAQRAQLGALEQERVALERRVEELRIFERDYRQKLRRLHRGSAPRARVLERPDRRWPAAARRRHGRTAVAPFAVPGRRSGTAVERYAYPQPTEYPGFAGS